MPGGLARNQGFPWVVADVNWVKLSGARAVILNLNQSLNQKAAEEIIDVSQLILFDVRARSVYLVWEQVADHRLGMTAICG